MKVKTAFFCNECGYDSAKWFGMCPACNAAGTAVEEKIDSRQVINTGVGIRGTASDKPKTFFCELEGIYARLQSTILVSNFVSKLNDAIDSILGTNAHLSYYIVSAIAEIGE